MAKRCLNESLLYGIPEVDVGIIAGSVRFGPAGITDVVEIPSSVFRTSYGEPSDSIMVGQYKKKDGSVVRAAFLKRHSRMHDIPALAVPFFPNALAFAMLGVEMVFSFSAHGYLRQGIKPGDFMVPHQIFDGTHTRRCTFFAERGLAVHVSLAQPFCESARETAIKALTEAELTVHEAGVSRSMHRPQFSTIFESQENMALGLDAIGMCHVTEAEAFKEACTCLAGIIVFTDGDAGLADAEDETDSRSETVSAADVSVQAVKSASDVEKAIPLILEEVKTDCWEKCHGEYRKSIMTNPVAIPVEKRWLLETLTRRPFDELVNLQTS